MNYKGVIFDLDGTILDSLKVWEKVDKKFFTHRDLPIPFDYEKKINGMTFIEAATYTKEACNIEDEVEDIIREWKEIAYYEYKNSVKLKSGVYEYLVFLKENGIKMGIATACDRELYEICLKSNKIYDFFDIIVDSSNVERGKEFPDIYELCAKKLGVLPKDCIVFEDILKAIKGAKKAGMTVYAVYDKHCLDNLDDMIEESDDYITDFREMLV